MPASILIVDDEKHTRDGLSAVLEDDYDVTTARDADEAFNLMEADEFDVVLTDLRMAGKSGLKVIDRAVKLAYRPVVIMMTAYGSVDTAVEAMKRGAFDFVTKPLNIEKLEILIKRALQSRNLEVENKELHTRLDQKYSFDGIIGNSQPLLQVLEEVKTVAPSKATVMLYGDTGTGKELVAQMVHQNSPRSRAAFVPVHCAAIPANLLESELFGHEKGAFTGADSKRIGRFEAADGGTLFLDEIGEIDPPTQVKLLRFLETRSFERLGSLKPIKVDVRLVCATNKNLREMVGKGTFREDLYYRLNVVPITLPSLRQRSDDIPLLITHFLKQFASENGMIAPEVTADAMLALQHYAWPGNIRELRNLCENLVVMKRGGQVTEYDLDPRFTSGDTGMTASGSAADCKPLKNPLSREENEKRLLRNALVEANGNRTQAAKLMGISRRTLHRKLSQWPELDI
ncbi:sigma-54 dependent transcriptional regulator [Rubellicoccus peritrichatus]|uniref:Sigma-54 dependent transcriptional regulator n=1 Tax=Rubellicoccus peritrichatus TaxID=3080537 RepID=A0AAQ3QQ20_9BACT|nr:sigma-54 dependent transcriptional regulator [Puniceicoccus sp. CR14]WOO39743.1 sigma-54 dependent transcriptional regulator [Puniceicoccus sp. CR14]